MEVLNKIQERRMVLAASVSIVVIGISLILFTWQILRRQDEAAEQHLLLSAKSVFDTLESVLRRNRRHTEDSSFVPQIQNIFKELEASGDVVFVGLIAPHGGSMVLAASGGVGDIHLPPEALKQLVTKNEWSGRLHQGGRDLFIYSRQVYWRGRMGDEGHGHMRGEGRGMMGSPGQPEGRGQPEGGSPAEGGAPAQNGAPGNGAIQDVGPLRQALPRMPSLGNRLPPWGNWGRDGLERPGAELNSPVELPVFLVVGINVEKHQAVYNGVKKNAIFQTIYILLAAIFIWGLSISFIARRDLAGKAAELERFQAGLLDNLPDGLLALDHEGMIYSANPVVHTILNVPPGGLVGRPLTALPPALRALVPAQEDMKALPLRHKLPFGGAQLEIICSSFKEKADDLSLLLIIRDRTKEHNLEKSLAEAEKLAAVGTLAAGVAHEIRNPLSALRGFAQYFAKKLAGQKPEETYAQSMVKEADRLNQVITDLLYLSHSKKLDLRRLDLASLVSDLAGLLQLDLAAQKIELRLDLRCSSMVGDEKSLKQSLLNLLLNSQDALGQEPLQKDAPGGATAPAEGRVITVRSYEDNGGICLEVQDNGPGMTQAHIKQAFEPFFTTKDKGTGLGLALVYKTMREHGGSCEIISPPVQSSGQGAGQVGRGLCVRLWFPLLQESDEGDAGVA